MTRMGILTAEQLRAEPRATRSWSSPIVAALLPGAGSGDDALIMMLPLVVLYEGSILCRALLDRRAARRRRDEPRRRDDGELTSPTRTTSHALRPQRPRPPPHRQDRVHHARLPHGRRPRPVRDRRRRRLSGGLVDAITQGGGSATAGTTASSHAAKAQASTKASPKDAAALGRLARARFNLAGTGDNVDQSTGNYTAAGAEQLRAAAAAWDRAPEAAGKQAAGRARGLPHGPGLRRASATSRRRSRRRRSSPRHDRDSAAAYATLATLAYLAGQTRKGDLARQKALALTEADQRETLPGPARHQAAGRAARPEPAGPGRARRQDAAAAREVAALQSPRRPRPCSSTGRAADS